MMQNVVLELLFSKKINEVSLHNEGFLKSVKNAPLNSLLILSINKTVMELYIFFGILQSSNLQNFNLQSSKLQNFNLQSSKLQNFNLQSSKLQNSKLQSYILQSYILHSSNLQNFNLHSSKLQSSKLQSSNLQSVQITVSDTRLY